jgi:hypothetical protein
MPHKRFYQRQAPDLSAHVQASIDAVGGVHDPLTGHYGELHHTGCESRERAAEIKRALYRAAGYKKVSMSARIVEDIDGTHRVIFKAINKEHARAYVKTRYGDNPPYKPGRRPA